jgi:endonuclease/exonuclease/phosphatase family metal-dependent hydrolase
MMYQPARDADLSSEDPNSCASANASGASSESEFHRCRAEAEMEAALAGGPLSVALCHLELARLHRERRMALGRSEPPPPPGAFCFSDRTDKEG